MVELEPGRIADHYPLTEQEIAVIENFYMYVGYVSYETQGEFRALMKKLRDYVSDLRASRESDRTGGGAARRHDNRDSQASDAPNRPE